MSPTENPPTHEPTIGNLPQFRHIEQKLKSTFNDQLGMDEDTSRHRTGWHGTSEEQRGCTLEDRTLIPLRTLCPPPRLTLRRRWRHRLPGHLPPPPQAQHPSVEGEAGADAEGGVPPVVRLVRLVDAPTLPREGLGTVSAPPPKTPQTNPARQELPGQGERSGEEG